MKKIGIILAMLLTSGIALRAELPADSVRIPSPANETPAAVTSTPPATYKSSPQTSGLSVKPDSVGLSDSSDRSDKSDKSDKKSFALKTNGLYWLAAIPNIGIEFGFGRRFTVGANWMYAWWQNHDRNRHWRIYGGDINARYYFNTREAGSPRPMTGHHIGVYGQVLVFQVAFGGKGYITGMPGENLWGKPYLGGGIEYGYSRRIGKRLNIDFSLGLGYMAGEYREYRPMDGHYVWQATRRHNWLGPTKAEITLVWLIGRMPGNAGKEGAE